VFLLKGRLLTIPKLTGFFVCNIVVPQQAAQKRRDVKEKKREKNLEARHESEPTQEAAVAIKQNKERLEHSHKEAMKRAVAVAKGQNSKNEKVKRARKTPPKLAQPPPVQTTATALPVLQGRHKIPTPGDDQGCKHRGLSELCPCDKRWLRAYVKEGAWLHKKPCVDCAARESTEEGEERVLDASVLLQQKAGIVAFICNCGPTGHKMKDGDEGKLEYQCNLMLCVPCYNIRQSNSEGGGGRKRRRRDTSY
jgi:hypothetical protein